MNFELGLPACLKLIGCFGHQKANAEMIRLISSGVILLTLAGCATPYQPINVGLMGGYYQAPMSGHKYMVGFSGNEFTTPGRAYDLAMLRAASIGESLGYSYFTINSVEPGAGTPAFPGFLLGVTYYNTSIPANVGMYSTANEVAFIEGKYGT